MAEGARLESVFTRKGNVGSNPTLSASFPLVRTQPRVPSTSPQDLGRRAQYAEGRFKHSVRVHVERGTNFPEKRVYKGLSITSRVFVRELLR